jgi:hypothetical protein
MKKESRKQQRRSTPSRPFLGTIKWAAIAAGIGLTLFAAYQSAGVAYDETKIRVVNFSVLSSAEKRTALRAANRARCNCGCGMSLAQCVSTDMTCPVRDENIQSIRTMVREADKS